MITLDDLHEEVAMAIREAAIGQHMAQGRDLKTEWKLLPSPEKNSYLRQASAALLALANRFPDGEAVIEEARHTPKIIG